ncbi:MAG TPA: hypothetical protein ENI98_06325 [Gammaproteobacteria bacterium]|nr:hypothetical protein [Gammaproteobacteria bacterium]
MKKIKPASGKGRNISALAILVLALSAIIPVSVNAKSPSYVLECRGGGKMVAIVNHVGNIKITGLRHARVAASVKSPGPGECAWLDRPMNKNEPFNLHYTSRKLPFKYVYISSNTVSLKWVNYIPIATVLKAIYSNKLFFVHVRRKRINKRWTLGIERVGP